MEEIEIWKPINGYDGHEVSNLGRIRSIDHYVNGHNVHTRKLYKKLVKGRIRTLDTNKYGYFMVRLKSKGKYHTVHRLVCEAFLANEQNLPSINHKDFNKKNNHVSNLEWCTVAHNNRHYMEKGVGIWELTHI